MKKDLQQIYENMLNEPLVFRIVNKQSPSEPLSTLLSTISDVEEEEEEEDEDYEEEGEEEDLSEEEEVELAREILTHVSDLDDLAKEAMYKSFRKKIEKHADAIRALANELIEGHGYSV